MTDSDFAYVVELVHDRTAVVIEPGKEYLVESRLAPLARRPGCESLGEFVKKPREVGAANLQGETNVHNFLGPQAWELAYGAAGWAMIAVVLAMRFAPAARKVTLAPLAVFRDSRFAAPLALAAGVMMQHHFLQELSELALAAAVAHAVGWIAARTPGRPASQRLVPA